MLNIEYFLRFHLIRILYSVFDFSVCLKDIDVVQAKVRPAKVRRSFVRSHICRFIIGRTFAYRHRQKCDPNYFIKTFMESVIEKTKRIH